MTQPHQDPSAADAKLQQVVYAVSHDFGAPVRHIESFLRLAADRLGNDLDETTQGYLDYVYAACDELNDKLSALLRYSRVHSGGGEPHPCSGQTMATEATTLLAREIKQRGATVDGVDTLPSVVAAPNQLRTLFVELLRNALTYCDGAPKVQLCAERQGDDIVFSVLDEGHGIEPRNCERVFELFQRLHRKDEYAGAGVGLAICQRIVERHGGRIWAEPRETGGAAFRFTLSAV